MGYDYDNSQIIKICVIGGSQEIIQNLFPDKIDSKKKNTLYIKRKKTQNIDAKDFISGKSANYKINWEAYIFKNMTDKTENSIMKTILFDIFGIPEEEIHFKNKKKPISKNNIIIKFGSNNTDFLIDCINILSRVYLPQIAIITNDEVKGIQDNRFLTIIKEAIQSELFKKIFNYLWERECYFNQRGQLISEYSPENLNPSKDLPCSSLNIMLTGMSRSGKSTLINVLSEKLVSLESPELLSVTTEINEYVIYKEIQEKIIKFKFIDTPGLTFIPEKNIDTTKIVIDSINKKLKEFNDTNDSIHIIYFFMAGIPNLEQAKKFFSFLNDLNTERAKKKCAKIPILFIFNHNSGINNFDALRKFLLENNYNNLYEKGQKTKITGNSLKDRINLIKGKNSPNIRDNIIGINLLKEYNNNGELVSNVFGISELLRATKYLIKKTNPFKDEDFNNIKLFTEKFKNFNSIIDKGKKLTNEQQEELKLLKENCKNLMIKISKENSLLYKLNDQNKIIEKAKSEAYTIIYTISALGFLAGMIPVPLLDLGILIPIYLVMIIKIGNCFNVTFSEIPNEILMKLTFGLEADVQTGVKIVGNAVGASTGEEFGKNLVKDMGKDHIKKWTEEGLLLAPINTPGHKVVEVINARYNLFVKNENKFTSFINYIYNLFPSFQEGVQKGIEIKGQKYANTVREIIMDNAIDSCEEYVVKNAERYSQYYGSALTANASSYLPEFLPKFIPLIGSLISGIMDLYSTYKVGENSIKYFEEYVKKTMCCEFVIKRKEEYENILNSLDILANINFGNLK